MFLRLAFIPQRALARRVNAEWNFRFVNQHFREVRACWNKIMPFALSPRDAGGERDSDFSREIAVAPAERRISMPKRIREPKLLRQS